MKKVFVLFLVLLLVASAAFAVTVSEKAGTENPATVNASLDLSGNGDAGFVKFGFYSGKAPENFSITTTTYGDSISDGTVKLYPTVDTTGDAKLIATNLAGEGRNDEFYLFYQIVSGTKYDLTLSLDGKMKLNDDPTLDWTVTLSDGSSTNVTTLNGEGNQSILTHDPYQDNATVTSAAAYNVTVTTEDISSLKQGTYEGVIKLTLTTEGAGA